MSELNVRVFNVPWDLLADEWKDGNIGGIFYAVKSEGTKGEHEQACEKVKAELLDKNEEKYTRWVHTGSISRFDERGLKTWTTVMRFRVRDSY